MVKIIVDIFAGDIAELEELGRSGETSGGYSQDFEFCLKQAIKEFITKYKK